MKKNVLNGTLLILVVIISGLQANAQKVGGYKPVEVDDERVTAAADFAIDKWVETHTEQEGLTLKSINKAEMQVVAGINYRLCLTVSLGDESQQVKTVVYQNLQKAYSLTGWKVEDCGESSFNHFKMSNYFKSTDVYY